MDAFWKALTWRQFGAAIDMIENAIAACPDDLWNDRSRQPQFWYIVYHTLFFLDLYSSDSVDGFAPPPPIGMEELDEDGKMPERPYTKDEMRTYLEHGRRKARERIENMTEEKARQRCGIEWHDISEAEMFLYNMRHVQHHAGQLNLILRQVTDSAPKWVRKAGEKRA